MKLSILYMLNYLVYTTVSLAYPKGHILTILQYKIVKGSKKNNVTIICLIHINFIDNI